MSSPGDVVFADGRAWTRTNWPEKSRWVTESDALPGNRAALRSLKMHDDFRWLVRNGERVELPIRTAHVCCPHCAPTGHHPHSEDAAEEWRRERDAWIATCDKLRGELAELREPKSVLQAYALGRDGERAAIVAFLRDPNWADMEARFVADHIERAEHRWPDDE